MYVSQFRDSLAERVDLGQISQAESNDLHADLTEQLEAIDERLEVLSDD